MNTYTATEARRELVDLLRGTIGKHAVYRIHHRNGDAVLLSEEDYESLLETLELLSTPGFRNSLRRSVRQMEKGQTRSLDEVFGADA